MNWKRCVIFIITIILFLPLSSFSINTDNQMFLEHEKLDKNLLVSSNEETIDNALWKKISMIGHEELIEVIVQFDSRNNGDKEEKILLENGFIPIYKTSVIPSIFASGPASKISTLANICLLYTSPSPRDVEESRMPSSA